MDKTVLTVFSLGIFLFIGIEACLTAGHEPRREFSLSARSATYRSDVRGDLEVPFAEVQDDLEVPFAEVQIEDGSMGPLDQGEIGKRIEVLLPDPLPQEAVLEGRVVDAETSLPIANATVQLNHENWIGGRSCWTLEVSTFKTRKTTTDRQGWFRFRALDPIRYRLVIDHENYAKEVPQRLARARAGQTVRFHDVPLVQGATVFGAVSDGKGSPVPKASVYLSTEDPSRLWMSLSGRTDEAGRFRFEQVPPGRFRLYAKRPHIRGEPWDPWGIKDVRETEQQITLRRGQTVSYSMDLEH